MNLFTAVKIISCQVNTSRVGTETFRDFFWYYFFYFPVKVYIVKVYIVAGVNTQSPVLNENPDSLVSSFITVQC